MPAGWRWAKLGEVCEVRKGFTPRREWYSPEGGLHIVKFRDVTPQGLNWKPGLNTYARPEFLRSLAKLEVGMTLVCADAHNPEYIGKKTCLVKNIPIEKAFFSGELIAVKPKDGKTIISQWVNYWLSSQMGYMAIQNQVVGVHLNANPAKNIEIPLPPLAEQKRIVAMLEKQIKEVNRAKKAAEKKLEAARLLSFSCLHQVFAKNKDGKLPAGWQWAKLGEVAEYINGMAFKPSDWEQKGMPIIRIQNLNNENAPFNCFSGDVQKKYIVQRGDLLVAWSASLGVYIWKNDNAILNQHIFKVVANESKVTKEYLYYALDSVMEDIKGKTHGATMKHITRKNFVVIKMPLPPLVEQKRIVAMLNQRMAMVSRIEKKAEKELEEINAMPAVLLRHAFKAESA